MEPYPPSAGIQQVCPPLPYRATAPEDDGKECSQRVGVWGPCHQGRKVRLGGYFGVAQQLSVLLCHSEDCWLGLILALRPSLHGGEGHTSQPIGAGDPGDPGGEWLVAWSPG